MVACTISDPTDERQVTWELLNEIGLAWSTWYFLFSRISVYIYIDVPVYDVYLKDRHRIDEIFHDILRQMRVRYPVVPRSSKKTKRSRRGRDLVVNLDSVDEGVGD